VTARANEPCNAIVPIFHGTPALDAARAVN
jgi:hypothetical protein